MKIKCVKLWAENFQITKIKNLPKVYNFKNDFNLDLKSSRVPASTISFVKLFQSFTTLIEKRIMFKTVNF